MHSKYLRAPSYTILLRYQKMHMYEQLCSWLHPSQQSVWAYGWDKLRCVSRYFSTIWQTDSASQAGPNKRSPYHLPHAHSRPSLRFSQSRQHHPRSPTPYSILPFNILRYQEALYKQ